MSEIPYADDVNYWKSGKSSPDTILEEVRVEISKAGGMVLSEGYMATSEGAGFVLEFALRGDDFRVFWPILVPRKNTPANRNAAKRQAVAMLFHDVKAKCVSAKVMGTRKAFFQYLVLPDGRVAGATERDMTELERLLPKLPPGRHK